ncbi:MAG: hypothetical protein U0Q21_06455 [Dermatophilaceae bacterium]
MPALLIMARFVGRVPGVKLVVLGAPAGIGSYLAMSLRRGPVPLVAVQVLNTVFLACPAAGRPRGRPRHPRRPGGLGGAARAGGEVTRE